MDVLNSKLFAGIDPGQKGAVALITADGEIVETIPLPNTTVELFSFLEVYKPKIQRLYIEKAQSMPGNGAASMFTYGKGYGAIMACLEILEIPHDLVAPSLWHSRVVGRTGSGRGSEPKKRSLDRARRLWPSSKFVAPGCQRVHDGIVDALLIAEYGRVKNVG